MGIYRTHLYIILYAPRLEASAVAVLKLLAAAALARIAFGVRSACALALCIARSSVVAAAFPAGREAEE